MTSRRIARLEEELEAEEFSAKRFSQYMSLAKDNRLREAFRQNRDLHERQCIQLRQELRG